MIDRTFSVERGAVRGRPICGVEGSDGEKMR